MRRVFRKTGSKFCIFKFFILAGIFIFSPSKLFSQYKNYQLQFNSVTIEDGLTNNKVNAVLKDKRGFIWFATNDGLCRYGGLKIWQYHLDPLKTKNTNTNHINTLCSGNDGSIWVGAFSLFRYDYESDSFVHYSVKDTTGDKINRIRSMVSDLSGRLWIGSINGLFSYYAEKDILVHHESAVSKIKNVRTISVDGDNIWVGTDDNGIFMYSISKETFSQLNLTRDYKGYDNAVQCFFKDNTNVMWAGTYSNGILKINASANVVEHLYPDKSDEISYRVRSIKQDYKGNIWIGSRAGLFVRFNGADSLYHYAHIKHKISKITDNSIFDIFIDNNKVMWIGTYAGGVNYTNLLSKPIYNFSKDEDIHESLSDNVLFGFCEDIYGNIYIGTNDGGLNYFEKKKGTFTSYMANPKETCSIGSNNIKSIVEDQNNNLWVGMYRDGVNYFNVTTKCFEKLPQIVKLGNSLISNNVFSLALDKNGDLWIGSDRGIDRLNVQEKTIDNIFKINRALCVYIDHNNRIWAGVENSGIFLYNEKTDRFLPVYKEIINTGINTIHLDSNDNLWIGGSIGLIYINRRDSSYKNYTQSDGLPTNLIMGILEDDHKNLWLSTTSGIVKCYNLVNNPDSLNLRIYTAKDGLQNNHFLNYSYFKSSSGEMFFGGIEGFSMFHPDSVKDNPFAPQIALTDIKIFSKRVPIAGKVLGKIILEKSIDFTDEITLSSKHKIFSFEFTALHNINPKHVKYRYMLYPFEKNWNQTDANNPTSTYSNLPGGKYTFLIMAANSDGVWTKEPYKLTVNILPPFWRAKWFIILTIILVIIIFILIYNSRINTIEKQKNKLEMMVQERTKTITEMNNLLKGQTKVLKKTNKLLEEQKNQITEQAEELEAQKEALLNQKNMLQNLNVMKDKFFSIIAHDLKGPFQGILGLADILANDYEDYTDDEKKQYFEAINNSSKNFYNLLDNLLYWARTQLEHITLDQSVFDLKELILNNKKLFKENCTKKKITVLEEYSNNTRVIADRNMIDTVIRNLLSNAVKFSNKGGTVHVSIENKGKEAIVSIKDSGIGMTSDQLESLFLIDKSVSRLGTSGELGTGLGLILCHEFITKNSGKIWVESEEGKGSTFYFTLMAGKN